MSESNAAPLSNADVIIGKINELQNSLRNNLPNYESLLHVIHVALNKDEECAILLTPEQKGTICAALSKKKGVFIATSTVKSSGAKTAAGKPLKDVSLGDLGG